MGDFRARGPQCLMVVGGKADGEIWGPFCLETYGKQHPGEEGVTSKAALKIYPGQKKKNKKITWQLVKQEPTGATHRVPWGPRGPAGKRPPAAAGSVASSRSLIPAAPRPFAATRQWHCQAGDSGEGRPVAGGHGDGGGDRWWPVGSRLLPATPGLRRPQGPGEVTSVESSYWWGLAGWRLAASR